jgi:uncharacterized membrane protein YoaT (DUF817 family)
MGSWVYPEDSLLRIGGVPLFTGFMYASVGSYIARAWRLFGFRFTGHPPLSATALLVLMIYVNFFTHPYVADMRVTLFLFAALLFGPAWVHFRVWRTYRRMPLLLGLGLVALSSGSPRISAPSQERRFIPRRQANGRMCRLRNWAHGFC